MRYDRFAVRRDKAALSSGGESHPAHCYSRKHRSNHGAAKSNSATDEHQPACRGKPEHVTAAVNSE